MKRQQLAAINNLLQNIQKDRNDQLKQSREVASALEQRNKEMDDYLEKVRSKYSTPVSLAGIKVSDASAKVFWMKDNGDVYVDPSNLPAIEKGKQKNYKSALRITIKGYRVLQQYKLKCANEEDNTEHM